MRIFIALLLATTSALTQPTQRRAVLQGGAASAAAALTGLVPGAASAKGRATQAAMMQRYSPRIESFGEYLNGDLESTIAKNDWAALAADCSDTDDKKKKVKLGPLYRGESAMDLWANTYSDVSTSPKTKAMLAEVEAITRARAALSDVACRGTGACAKATGGFFGFGAKAAPPPAASQLVAEATKARGDAKAAFNRYVGLNNQRVPLDINPLRALD